MMVRRMKHTYPRSIALVHKGVVDVKPLVTHVFPLERIAEARAGLAAGGMTVQPAGDALMAELRAIGETMTAEWLEAAGEEGAELVNTFKEMQ